MHAAIDPQIHAKILAFRRRRRGLILLRGGSALLIAALAALTVVALVDFTVVLEDWQRYLFAGLVYALAGATCYWTCLRQLWRKLDEREVARLVEAARPELRESVLAAVELGEVDSGAVSERESDTAAFRQLMQTQVAGKLAGISLAALLPTRLVGTWVKLAAVMLAICLALLCVPRFHFGTLLVRAALPLANIERVSRVQITISAPRPAEMMVPAGDQVAVLAEVSDPSVDTATLDIAGADGAVRHTRMEKVGRQSFSAVVQTAQVPLTYRVRAGDAVTRRYALTVRPRPEVVTFTKVYHFPSYTGWPDKTVTEPSGELAALEGSTVDLTLHPNQPMRSGELRLDGEGAHSLPLTINADHTLHAVVPLAHNGTYRVQLIADETGFDNTFSPRYEIRAQPDLLPAISLLEPAADLNVAPDAVVGIRAVASDDLAVRVIMLAFRVDAGQWQEVPIYTTPTLAEVKLAYRWDLLKLGLQPGDVVAMKLAVFDLKNSRVESAVRMLVVSARGLAQDRHRAVQAWKNVRQALATLQTATADLAQQGAEQRKALAAAGTDETRRQQVLASFASDLAKGQARVDDALAQVKAALPQVSEQQGNDALVDVGRGLSRLREENLAAAQRAVATAAATPVAKVNARDLDRTTESTLRAAKEQAAKLAQATDRIIAEQEAAAVGRDLHDLAAEQQRLNELAKAEAPSKDARDRVERHEDLINANIAATAQMLAQLKNEVDPRMKGAIAAELQQVEQAGKTAEQVAKTAPNGDLKAPLAATQAALERAAQAWQPATQEIARDAQAARQELDKLAGNETKALDDARQGLQQAATELGGKKPERADKPLQDATEAVQQVAARLATRADLEELRPQPDAKYVQDLATTAAALERATPKPGTAAELQQQAATLQKLDQAQEQLAAAHELHEAADALRQLALQEHDAPTRPADAQADARAWAPQDQQLRQLAANAQPEAALAPDAAKALQQALATPAANALRQEMAARDNPAKTPTDMTAAANQVAQAVAQEQAAIQPAVDAARRTVAGLAPTLADKLADLAQQAQAAHADTARELQPAAGQPTADDARKLLKEQEQLNDRIADARTDLRRDANAQDLGEQAGRERARDAEDALAMLAQPPAAAEEALRAAAAAPAPEARQQLLQQAEPMQAKTAADLQQLAQHFAKADQGQPEQTRPGLRAEEQALGIKNQLDGEFALAKTLAELPHEATGEAIKQLEQHLATDPAMQQALGQLAQHTAQEAQQALAQAAKDQGELATRTNALTQAGTPPGAPALAQEAGKEQALAAQAHEAGQDLARAGQDAQRLGQAAAGQQMAAAGQQAQQAADQPMQKAAQALAGATPPAAAQTQVNQAWDAIKAAAAQAAALPTPGAPTAHDVAPTPVAQYLAQALDTLDQAQAAQAAAAPPGASQAGQPPPGATPAGAPPAGAPSVASQAPPGQAPPAAPSATSAASQAAQAAAAQAQATAAQAAAAKAAGQPGQPAAGQPAAGQPAAGQPAQTAAATPGQPGQAAPGAPAAAAAAAQAAMAQAQAAISAAAQQQSQAMANARMASAPTNGAALGGTAASPTLAGPAPAAVATAGQPANWAQLPPRLVRDLKDAQVEHTPEQYREAVKSYFKVIAERAQKQGSTP